MQIMLDCVGQGPDYILVTYLFKYQVNLELNPAIFYTTRKQDTYI